MADDPFVFFVESVHGGPRERDTPLEFVCVVWQFNVLPCASRRTLIARTYGVPGCETKVAMPRGVLDAFYSIWSDVGRRKIGHWIVARFEQQEHMFAIGNPGTAKAHAHAPAQRLGV